MKPVFVKTSNAIKFYEAIINLKKRGASEACLMVLDGAPGLGKSTLMTRFAVENQCIYLRAKKEWTPSWFMRALLEELRLQPPHSFEAKYNMAIKTLSQRQSQISSSNLTFTLIIDEADHISGNSRIIETIRDLSDMLEVPVILVGMGKIRSNLNRFPQVTSRISQYVNFHPATREDVRKLFDEMCEVKVADDLANFVHKVTQGMNREIKEAMAVIERFGKRNPPEGEGGLKLADMAGQHLVNDRSSSQSIIVPEFAL